MIAVMAFQCISVSWSCRLRKSKSQRKELAELSVAGRHASVCGGGVPRAAHFLLSQNSDSEHISAGNHSLVSIVSSPSSLLSVGHFRLF